MTSDLDIRERARVAALMAQPDAVFVFGSNIDGQHASGAARVAFDLYGAEWGVGEGLRGRSYALPTMLPFEDVALHVECFLNFARHIRPDLAYAVTRVGCGIRGFSDAEMAPLFAGAPDNCELPEGWR